MYDIKNHPVDPAYAKDANMTLEQYQAWYKESLEQPDQFWSKRAEEFLTWSKPWTKVNEYDFPKGEATWFKDGSSMPLTTVSTATWKSVVIRWPLSGKATTPKRMPASPIRLSLIHI